jgi:hypothetical protein
MCKIPVEEREAMTAALYERLHDHQLLTPLGKWAEVGAGVKSAFRACINTALVAREVEELLTDAQRAKIEELENDQVRRTASNPTRRKLWMQCPGCFSAELAEDMRPEGWQECECGERLTVIDLRDRDRDLTADRGDLPATGPVVRDTEREHEPAGDRPMTRDESRAMWGEVYKKESTRFRQERDEAKAHAEVLAKALDQFLRAHPKCDVLPRSSLNRLWGEAEPTLQALGYMKVK